MFFIADNRYEYFCITQAVSILPHKAKQTLLELFCLQSNIFKLQLKDITVHFFL